MYDLYPEKGLFSLGNLLIKRYNVKQKVQHLLNNWDN